MGDGARRIGPQHVQPSPGERTTQPVQHPDAWDDGLLAETVNESVDSS